MEQYTYLEWNVNARGGNGGKYTIPDWLSNYTTLTDIVVLTEFRCDNNWEKFKSDMEKEYYVFVSPYTTEWYNQVLVAVKKSKFKVESVKTIDIMDDILPEFLRVDLITKESNTNISVIGVRIKIGNKKDPDRFLKRNKQYIKLNDILKEIPVFLCIGDFNPKKHEEMENLLDAGKRYGPRTVKREYYSLVGDYGGKYSQDWLFVKGIEVKDKNPFPCHDKSPNATYCWTFISKEHGYAGKTKEDYLGIDGLPDHAMLMGAFEIRMDYAKQKDFECACFDKILARALSKTFPDGGEKYTRKDVIKYNFENEGVDIDCFDDILKHCVDEGWITDCGNGIYTRKS